MTCSGLISNKKVVCLVGCMDEVVLITGASSGIGRAVAKRFYAEGYNLVLTSRSELSLEELGFSSARVATLAGDIREESTARELVALATRRFSRLDVVVNNAGVGVFNSVEDVSAQEFSQQLDTNVLGPFFVVKHALPVLREQDRGQIVMVSSLAGKNFVAGGSAYCASKWALQGFTGSLKQELRDTHIKVGSVLPGSVDTPFFSKAGASLNQERYLAASSVAQAVLQLAQQPVDADVDEVVLRPALK